MNPCIDQEAADKLYCLLMADDRAIQDEDDYDEDNQAAQSRPVTRGWPDGDT